MSALQDSGKEEDPSPDAGEQHRKSKVEEADVLDFVEALLSGVVLLAARFWRTFSHYLFRPQSIWSTLSSASRPTSGPHLRPLTFLFASYLAFVVVHGLDRLGLHPDRVESPADLFPLFSGIALGAVRELDTDLLVVAIVPLVLAVALVAAFNRRLSRTFRCPIREFKQHLSLESYFVGSLLWVHTVALLLLRISVYSLNDVIWVLIVIAAVSVAVAAPLLVLVRAVAYHSSVLRCHPARSVLVCVSAWCLSAVVLAPAVYLLSQMSTQ